MDGLEMFFGICLGIGLSAACGFRVFVPLLCLSIGAISGHIHLANSFAWIGTKPALIAFAAATVLEIAAYYIPYLDNLMDSIAVPVATIAGVLVTASVITDVDPVWRWTLAIIAGGGAALSTQLTTTKLRAASSATTGGLGNPVLSTLELGFSGLLSSLAVFWPVIAFILVILVLAVCWFFIYFVGKRIVRLFRRTSPSA